MGITITHKTKTPRLLKIFSQLVTYVFEEEYDEMRNLSNTQNNKLKKIIEDLGVIINNK